MGVVVVKQGLEEMEGILANSWKMGLGEGLSMDANFHTWVLFYRETLSESKHKVSLAMMLFPC